MSDTQKKAQIMKEIGMDQEGGLLAGVKAFLKEADDLEN